MFGIAVKLYTGEENFSLWEILNFSSAAEAENRKNDQLNRLNFLVYFKTNISYFRSPCWTTDRTETKQLLEPFFFLSVYQKQKQK